MTRNFCLLISLLLAGCGSLPKAGPQAALYDFGIGTDAPPILLSNIRIAGLDAAPGLEGTGMRYRLAYQNPARIFSFTESRWAASPDKLLARRLEQRLQASGPTQCTMRITLDAFDQIFDQPDRSHALVLMHATLSVGTTRQGILHSFQSRAEQAADTADARGGAAALVNAADRSLEEIATWASSQACTHTSDKN